MPIVPWLGPADPFPPADRALVRPDGLLAAGADLSPARLLDAYRHGIFPWPDDDGPPMLWWSPDPRLVLVPSDLRVSRSLRKRVRAGTFRVTFDRAPADVLDGCAAPRDAEGGTWITREIRDAYLALHAAGHMHSVEAWRDDRLVGGLYGVSIGRMFFGESMFARETDASKVAFVWLVRQLDRWGVDRVDCQVRTDHLVSLGAREVPRARFLADVAARVAVPGPPLPWRFDADLVETV
ncbi:MAG: leucyl/phenylalanyl-tRNA--protein transferase [Vicinamibacterales bacterium]